MATTLANVNDLDMAGALLQGQEHAAFGDAGYQGVHKRPEADFVAERVEKMEASIRAEVEHPFRVLKRQFGFTKVRYRRLRGTRGRSSRCSRWAICGWRGDDCWR